jgi:hypothetical protein
LAAARCERRTVDLDNGTTLPFSSSNGQPHRLHNLATSDLDTPCGCTQRVISWTHRRPRYDAYLGFRDAMATDAA